MNIDNLMNDCETKIREIKAFSDILILFLSDYQNTIAKIKVQNLDAIEKKDKEIAQKDKLIKELKNDLYKKGANNAR